MKPKQSTGFKKVGFIALILITSACLPVMGNATEVSVFSDVQNNHICIENVGPIMLAKSNYWP